MKPRIIFVLLYNQLNFYISRNFVVNKIGDIHWVLNNYHIIDLTSSVDELLIVALKDLCVEDLIYLRPLLHQSRCPVTIGGQIASIEGATRCFDYGADRILFGSRHLFRPELLESCSNILGAQALTLCLDYRMVNEELEIRNQRDGFIAVSKPELKKRLYDIPVVEILFQSYERDGTGQGFDIKNVPTLSALVDGVKSIVLMGGGGKSSHILEAIGSYGISGVATANILSFIGNNFSKISDQVRELYEAHPRVIQASHIQ